MLFVMKKLLLLLKHLISLFLAVDHLEAIVYSIAEGGEGKRDVKDVVEKLQTIEKGQAIVQSAAQEVAAASAFWKKSETVTNLSSEYDEFEITVLQQSKEQGFNVMKFMLVYEKTAY